MAKVWGLISLLVLQVTSAANTVSIKKPLVEDAVSKKIEAFTDQAKLERLTVFANQIAERYTSDNFLCQLMHGEQIRFEKMRAHNNRLLCEIPVYSLEKILVPRVGLYVKDLYELLSWGSEIAVDWQLKNRLHALFIDYTFYYLTHLDEKTLAWFLDDQAQGQSDGVVVSKQTEQWLTDLASRSLRFPFSLLKKKEIMRALSKSVFIDHLINFFRKNYLVKDHVNQTPTPLFSLLKKNIISGIFFNSAQMSTLAFATDFIKKQGFPSCFFSQSFFIQGLATFACQIYFVRSMMHDFLTSQWEAYLLQHQDLLKKLLHGYRYLKTKIRLCRDGDQDSQIGRHQASEIKKQEEFLNQALKSFIANGQKIPLTKWVSYKQQKYIQWDFGLTLLLSLPSLCQFGKKIYGIYAALIDKKQGQVGG